jgi:hypothetical protein
MSPKPSNEIFGAQHHIVDNLRCCLFNVATGKKMIYICCCSSGLCPLYLLKSTSKSGKVQHRLYLVPEKGTTLPLNCGDLGLDNSKFIFKFCRMFICWNDLFAPAQLHQMLVKSFPDARNFVTKFVINDATYNVCIKNVSNRSLIYHPQWVTKGFDPPNLVLIIKQYNNM